MKSIIPKRGDLICIASIVLLALLIAFIPLDAGNTVSVTTPEGKYSYPLDRDGEYVLSTEKGSLTLVISSGYAFVRGSDCRDKVCERTGKVNKGSIVCLPLGIHISIERGQYDEIAG